MAAVIKQFFLSKYSSFLLNSKLSPSVFFVCRHDSNLSDKDNDINVKDAATASHEKQSFAKSLEKLDLTIKQLQENDRLAKETVSKNILLHSAGRSSNEKKPKKQRFTDFEIKRKAIRDKMTFTQLFRESQHVRLGDTANAVVFGTIFKIVSDDLYIDFGGKFHCVCKIPAEEEENKRDNENRLEATQTKNLKRKWRIGVRVLVLIKDLEMTSRFMGYDKDMTLLEADAKLLGLATSSYIPTY